MSENRTGDISRRMNLIHKPVRSQSSHYTTMRSMPQLLIVGKMRRIFRQYIVLKPLGARGLGRVSVDSGLQAEGGVT